jgi:hypothetical protein
VLHARKQVLEDRIGDIADEEIRLRVAVGQKRIKYIRGIRNRLACG